MVYCYHMKKRRFAASQGGSALITSQDTIAAPATAPGEGGIAIVRVSGPRSREALSRLTVRRGPFEVLVLNFFV